MKVLIFGDKGWIGEQFIEYMGSGSKNTVVVRASDSNCRADAPVSEIKNILLTNDITHVISFIGRTHGKNSPNIDYLQDIDTLNENMRDNLYAPLNLVYVCRLMNVHYTYLGTGCIFEYDYAHPYADVKHGFMEDDKPNFFGSAYSVVKGFTDRLMHQHCGSVLNLRIRMPITSDDSHRNFVTKILKYPKVISVPNSMSVLSTLFPCILSMMCRQCTGTVNLCNPGVITHNEILEMYKKYVDPEYTWENFSLVELNAVTKAGRSNNCLDTALLEQMCPEVPNIHDAVEQAMKNYCKS